MRLKTFLTVFMITFVTGSLLPLTSAGQQTYRVTDASTMTIHGTSNVTDWEAKVKTISGEIIINIPDGKKWSEADASWFQRVNISMAVESIDADSRRMNNNIHGYLKKNAHPNVTYQMKEAQKLVASSNPGAVLTALGVVTAAGTPFEIEHDVKISLGNNNRLIVSGSKELNMTDFGIDPPTAMLGSVRAHDKMNITFELVLEAR